MATDDDGVNSAYNRNYGYDFLSRLTSMTAPNAPSANSSYTYDRWGNLYQATGSSNWNVSVSGTTNQITTGGFAYDNAGRLTSDGGGSYSWNALGLMTGFNNGSAASYVFDAFGRRVHAATPLGTFDYYYDVNGALRGVYDEGNNRWKTLEIGLGAGTLETYDSAPPVGYSNFTYTGTSLLGSTAFRYNPSAGAQNYHFLPYGLQWPGEATDATTNLKWTGHEQDAESGLYHFLFRNYAPLENRWLSPDPAGWVLGDPARPQLWNRYGYGASAPSTFLDDCGLCIFNVNLHIQGSTVSVQVQGYIEAEIARIFGLANQSVSFSGMGDGPTTTLGIANFSATNPAYSKLDLGPTVLGVDPGFGPSAFVFSNRVLEVLTGGSSYAFIGTALGRLGAHEILHHLGLRHAAGTVMQPAYSPSDLGPSGARLGLNSIQSGILQADCPQIPLKTIPLQLNSVELLPGGGGGGASPGPGGNGPGGGPSIWELYWEWLSLQPIEVVTHSFTPVS